MTNNTLQTTTQRIVDWPAKTCAHQLELDIHSFELELTLSNTSATVEQEEEEPIVKMGAVEAAAPVLFHNRDDASSSLIPTTNEGTLGIMDATSFAKSHSTSLQQIKTVLETGSDPLDLAWLSRLCIEAGVRGHLAVLTQPYLDRIIAGQKTIESRFSKVRGLPFQHVQGGDVVLLKEAAGPILAITQVEDATFFGPLPPGEAESIMERYQDQLQLDPPFKEAKRESTYVTLVHLEQVVTVTPRLVTKTDRRAWVVLENSNDQVKAGNSAPQQMSLFKENSHCARGTHRYYDSKQFNNEGNPICRYCGIDVIPWSRIHQRDLHDMEHTIVQLRTEEFRESWWTKDIDLQARNHALRKGLTALRQSARTRLWKSVGVVFDMPDGTKRPYRDGLQTPYSGNSIYYAQHALACCCRKCMRYWHGVPIGRDLTEQELDYFVELVMRYITEQLPEIQDQGISIPRRRRV